VERGRRIAFDYGDSRIGVAICDPDGILATPLPYLDTRHPKLMAHIAALFEEYAPIHIYLGEPKNLSGDGSSSLEKVKIFASELEQRFHIPITLIDERLSTVDAQRRLREAGKNAQESRSLIDSMAAVAILEGGLARAR
jgi:putative Holliday junction resolvase